MQEQVKSIQLYGPDTIDGRLLMKVEPFGNQEFVQDFLWIARTFIDNVGGHIEMTYVRTRTARVDP